MVEISSHIFSIPTEIKNYHVRTFDKITKELGTSDTKTLMELWASFFDKQINGYQLDTKLKQALAGKTSLTEREIIDSSGFIFVTEENFWREQISKEI